MRKVIVILVAALALGLAACNDDSGSSRETKATLIIQNEASTAVGTPAIRNFTEKRMMKMLYELRDNAHLVTYTYYLDLAGKRHKICPTTSIGYGIPFSAQFTAPKAARAVAPVYPSGTEGSWMYQMVDQPEPNGLYMPSSSSATWVMCMDPATKKPVPVYVEPNIIVSPFELSAVD
jgi:hypothetical protein